MNDRVSAAPPPGFLGSGAGDGMDVEAESERYHLRRPRSTAGWVRPGQAGQVQQEGGREQAVLQRGGGGGGHGVVTAKKSGGFLAPLWDGVREKLLLRGSKSSGNMGRAVNSVVAERKVERGPMVVGGEERNRDRGVASSAPTAPPVPVPSTAGYPSREEVMESYKNLVASGFFEAHAIRGGRHPLPPGANAPVRGPVVVPAPTGRSFADHMAAAQQQHQLQPAVTFASPTRENMGPPPLPARSSSQGKDDTIPSPQRGTKRGASVDLAGEAEMVTRKLVKKLRHSASRISVELSGARDNIQRHHFGYNTANSRPSTSSNPSGPLSPTSSVFSGITSPPRATDPATDDTASIRHGKLVKTKDGRRRRILGLTRRGRTPAAESAHPDPDAMVLDEPEHPPPPPPHATSTTTTITEQHHQHPRPARILTPPPASFRSRTRTSNHGLVAHATQQTQTHEPLSVVPDPNMGIPFVPRIPREFCEAMAELVPAAVVTVEGSTEGKGMGKTGGGNANRDSGLGEDVENIPVWG